MIVVSEGYTPPLDDVRAEWIGANTRGYGWVPPEVLRDYAGQFDRVIAEVERAVAEKAWDEGHGYPCDEWVDSRMCDEYHVNPYRRKGKQ